MAKERSAIATIKGYYYQFDYFILQLLKCNNETDSICIEGIEDVDLKTVDESYTLDSYTNQSVNYVKSKLESKSLKLYLFSFRNQGDFHEDCINIIMKAIAKYFLVLSI